MEEIGMSIEIGGTLPRKLINDFLSLSVDDSGAPSTPETLAQWHGPTAITQSTVRWEGTTNFGECHELKAFLRKHRLSYIHRCNANDEYDASIEYWLPGLKKPVSLPSNQDGCPVVQVCAIEPLINLILKAAWNPVPHKTLANPQLARLEKQIRKLLVHVPTLPPLTIEE